MDDKQKLIFRIIGGAIIIAATIFLSFKYMLKGPPFVKVLAIGLIAAVVYLVISFIKSKTKTDE